MTRMVLPGRTLLLVAGMPGAGKTTLLAALPARPDVVVLDSDAFRSALAATLPVPRAVPYAWVRPLVHLLHRFAVLRAACSGVPAVVVHLPATARGTRATVARLAALTRREAHLLWLDVDPAAARRGQNERGRVVPESLFDTHAARAAVSTAELRSGHAAGFASVTLLDRRAARAGLSLHTAGASPVRQAS